MRVKRLLFVVCITTLISVAAIGWLLKVSDDPTSAPRIRESILLRCVSDLASAWAQAGTLDRGRIRQVLTITASQSERFAISWNLDHVEERPPFARIVVEEGDHVTRVFIIDLVDKRTGYVVYPGGYRKLESKESAMGRVRDGEALSGFLFPR